MTKRYVFADIESHNAGRQYGISPLEFFRLGQWAVNDGEVNLTTDYDEFMAVLESADYLVFHNGISFDLSVLYGVESMRPLELAIERKIIDTFVLASLVNPAPYSYVNKDGRTVFDGAKPERAKKWLSLDEQAHQLGVEGKLGNLKELAARHNPPKTAVRDLDYGLIPLDDEDFLAYAKQDVIATRHIYYRLVDMLKRQNYSGEYVWREMLVWSINAQITRNGVLVNTAEAQARVDELAAERDKIMDWLVSDFDMPTNSKQPWKSNAGKGAILKAFDSFGIHPEDNPTWPRTAGGAPSFSGDTMRAVSEGTEAEKLGEALATLQGQRSLAQLALESTYEDGRIHPEIACLQRSGRTSVQRPGLTVWTARGPGAVEKRYFIADPGHVMVEMDYAAADARAVAAVSGDDEFAKRFAPGVDAHDLTGEIFFGYDDYHADRDRLRQIAKIGGHSLSYRVGAKKLAASVGVTVPEAMEYIDNYKKAYPWVTRWQENITREGDTGRVTNWWGRKMVVDPDRSFNQSSALIGQSTTREILFDGLIAIALDRIELIRYLRMTVHDAVVWSIPQESVEEDVEYILGKMTQVFDPGTNVSQPIEFPMSVGPLDATDWYGAGH
ncbi:DNA polymerase I [Microbacterium phage LeeroyJenkins]|nr:DNA polymerase I [Microbacterium phage LeeroyJenkins]